MKKTAIIIATAIVLTGGFIGYYIFPIFASGKKVYNYFNA